MSNLDDMNRRCVFCGQTTRSSEWRGNTGDICPNCQSMASKSREQIELELVEAINNLTLAIQNLYRGPLTYSQRCGALDGQGKIKKNR
jgi:hypothetical protein